jgi:hypothetical protein
VLAEEIYFHKNNRNLGSYSLQAVRLTTEIKLNENMRRCSSKVRISLQDVLKVLLVGNIGGVWCDGRGEHTVRRLMDRSF